MEQTFLAEAAKQSFVVFVLCACLVVAFFVIRALWVELSKEREARITTLGQVLVTQNEVKVALGLLTDAVRSK